MTPPITRYEVRALPTAHHLLFSSIPFVGYFIPSIFTFICRKPPLIGVGKNIKGSTMSGFTLIELIVAVVIIGILATLSAPAMRDIVQNNRLSTQVNDLVSDLNFARSEAIKRATDITVCKRRVGAADCDTAASATWTAGRVVFQDRDADGQIDSGEELLRLREGLDGRGNTLTSADTTTTSGAVNAAIRIVFFSSGVTSIRLGEQGQFRFCDARGTARAITVRLLSSGRTYIDDAPPPTCP